ncbi:MAG: phosphoserine phosphatase RsbU/P [Actinomycetota bacterium]
MARPLSTREARRFVADFLTEQQLSAYIPRATLSVSELSANAVLHTARPFTVSVQNGPTGVRIEVVDSAPHLKPVRVPTHGTAADLTWLSETGRGLLIVSSLANRWGVVMAQNVKTVWCEFDSAEPQTPSEPMVEDGRPSEPRGDNVYRLQLIGLPVRAAIASGLDVDEAIRDVQAEGARGESPELTELLDLVDRTASLRLAGRHAAFHASSLDEVQFDLELETSDEEMAATAKLNRALRARGRAGPSDEVIRFREWLAAETRRQREGKPPEPYAGDRATVSSPLEWLWDQAQAGYAAFSLDGVLLHANDLLREWMGGDPSQDFIDDVVQRVAPEGEVADVKIPLPRRDGTTTTALLSAIVERDDAGAAVAVHAVVRPPAAQDTDQLIRALQQTLIPPAPPVVPGLDVAALYHPAQGDVGGDFYDVFEVAEGDWCAVLGDVSGKGIEAAIVTSTARHAVRSCALRERVPSGLMRRLNEALLEKGSTRFCTVALLRVQNTNGAWVATLTSAGHPFPLLVRHGTATRLGRAGSLLGMFAEVNFHDVSIRLAAGDALVLYTDGVTEARDGTGAFYGEERMYDAIASAGSSARAIVDAVLSSVLAFQEGPADDIALVVIRRPSL